MPIYKRFAHCRRWSPLAAALLMLCAPLAAAADRPVEVKTVAFTSTPWAPYIGPQLPENGYIFQLVKRAFALSGYALQVDFYPWARALHNARTGSDYAGVFPEYYSPGREKKFIFSEPFPCGPVSLFKRRGSPPEFGTSPVVDQEKALSELQQYRFGVVRGYINTEVLDNAEFLRREESRSDELNLRKLHFGRVDLVAIDPYVANHLLSTSLAEYDGELVRMQPALEDKQVHIAFSKRASNHRELLAAFNSGLAELKRSGGLRELLREFGFDELADKQ